ncbi:MAG: glycosyltransferase, partial [Nitrospirae bacterium]|nr:glycosyltransferase [Nitrospirota bacterium]
MKNNKIMFVIPSLEGGGAEKVASNLLNEFSKSEIDVILV